MANFSIKDRFATVGDIVRTYNFEIVIPAIAGVTSEDMTIRANTAVIPGRSTENSIETVFMGQKQFFPGKPVFPHSLAIEFDEFEDRKVSKFLLAWQEEMHSINKGSATVGVKSGYTKTIKLNILDFAGSTLDTIHFHKAWIQDVADVSLGYADSAGLKYAATFQYDRWSYDGKE